MLTPEQLRTARKLLGWSRYRLSVRSNTPKGFIIEFEKSGRIAKVLWRPRDFDALAAIRTALEAAGVEFANGDEPGVKLKRQPE